MKRTKSKLTALLLTACCGVACLGFGVVSMETPKTNVTAMAEENAEYTTYEMGALSVRDNVSTNKRIYANTANYKIAELPFQSWTDLFEFESGSGLKINGETAAMGTMYSSDNGITFTFPEVTEAGTVVSIGGTFTCATKLSKYVIEDSSFIWDGAKWANYVPVEKYELGTLTVHPHSAGTTTNTPKATALYLKTDIELPFTAWSDKFNLESGDGWKLNGNAITPAEFISADGNLFVNLTNANVQVGDVLSVSGTFVHTTENAKYVIEESKFAWNGTKWENYEGTVTPDPAPDPEPDPEPDPDPIPTEYTTYEMGALTVRDNVSTKKRIYATTANYKIAELPFQSWTDGFELESGSGLKINGEAAMIGEMHSSDNGITFTFPEVTEVGTILSIGGTFRCPTKMVKYVLEDSTFVWNGTKWEAYVEYTTYNLDGLTFRKWDASKNHMYILLIGDWARPDDGNGGWTADFLSKNGVGVMFGENKISTVRFPGEMFIELGSAPAEGDVLTVGGTFYNTGCAVQYVIPESVFIYKNGTWNNALDLEKTETLAALDNYLATFVEVDYYPAEWALLQTIVTDAKEAINEASSSAAVETLLNEAKAAMDEVATKAEMDANFVQWKDEAKAELETYKDATLYREAEQAIIASTVAKAKTDIDASTNWAEFNAVVVAAKAAMDALWTDAQWTAAEDVVAAAKDELAAYKTQSDYKEAQWSAIQSILAEANAEIDMAIGDAAAIADIVANAKAQMDAVKTGAQIEAEEMAVLTAKAELEEYKTQSEYNEAEWNEIESILAGAYERLDEAIGDDEAIASIVAEAKTAMDKVLKAEAANAKALADAKDRAEQEIQDYINGINYNLYSDAAVEEINGYFTAAMDALDAATAVKDVAPIVADMKAKIEGVAKLEGAGTTSSDSEKPESGCSCSSSVGATAGLTLAVGVVVLALRKKKDGAEG